MTSITAHDVTSNVTLRMADAVYYDAQKVVVTDRQAAPLGEMGGRMDGR